MEKTATQKAWEAFVKKWQLVVGRAKRRGATSGFQEVQSAHWCI